MPTLIIAEKPSVARGIADAVGAHERRDGYIEGGGYLISWCRGHIIDLDFPQNYPQWSGHWSMSQLPMIPERWRWSVTAPEQYKVLKGLLDRADVEIAHCDPTAARARRSASWRVFSFSPTRRTRSVLPTEHSTWKKGTDLKSRIARVRSTTSASVGVWTRPADRREPS